MDAWLRAFPGVILIHLIGPFLPFTDEVGLFTGMIETFGVLDSALPKGTGCALRFMPEQPFLNLGLGESISVDGVCLTVEEIQENSFSVFAVNETLRRSTLGRIRKGARVNLERALRVGDRLGGHWVTGHVDTIAEIVSERASQSGTERWFRVEERYLSQIAEKGSVAVDGISLTVAYRESWGFSVSLIPFTLKHTTAGQKTIGSNVNIETDILAKYVQGTKTGEKETLTLDSLKKMGY